MFCWTALSARAAMRLARSASDVLLAAVLTELPAPAPLPRSKKKPSVEAAAACRRQNYSNVLAATIIS